MNKNYLFYRNLDNKLRVDKDAINFNEIIESVLKPEIVREEENFALPGNNPFASLLAVTKEDKKTAEITKPSINVQKPLEYKIGGQGLIIGSNLINYSAIKLDNRSKNRHEMETKFFQNTLQFDYTLGEVIVPGSSVKGALRATMEMGVEEVHLELDKIGICTEKAISALFENDLPLNEYVTYFDATIEGVTLNGKRYLYSKESITPINDDMVANPLNFIKVVPQSTIKFNIKVPKQIDEILKGKSTKILSLLIENSEFGAKGNTGFGSVRK